MDVSKKRLVAACVLVVYSAILVRFIVFKAVPTIHIGHVRLRFSGTRTGPANLVPFRTIGPLLSGHGNHLIAAVNLLGNIIPFLPVGFLAAFLFRKRRWGAALLFAIAVGTAMECMEWVFHVGIVDVDDVIVNALGVMLGYGIFAALG